MLLRLGRHYTLIQGERLVGNGNRYLVESSTKQSSCGDVLSINVSKLGPQSVLDLLAAED